MLLGKRRLGIMPRAGLHRTLHFLLGALAVGFRHLFLKAAVLAGGFGGHGSARRVRLLGGRPGRLGIARLGQAAIQPVAVAVKIGLGGLLALGLGIELVVHFLGHAGLHLD